MARKLRLEFPGAIYHVINRGNNQRFIFRTPGASQAFVTCLFQACVRSQWVLHAFVVMGNHFHLALETPLGNLVAGMQWLQSTFANRFNRLRSESGHLFQGRFQSLLVEDGGHLGNLCHYLHLNPSRAGIIPIRRLAEYRCSSYWYLHHPRERPKFLRVTTALAEAGPLADTPAGRRSYCAFLAWQMSDGPAGRSAAYVTMSRGWAIGSAEFKQSLLESHHVSEETRAWERGGARQVREEKWRIALERLVAQIPAKTKADQRGAAPWKIKTAAAMKAGTDADNRWLAEQLKVGSPQYLAKLVSGTRRK